VIGPTFELEHIDGGEQRHLVVRGEIDIKTAPQLETALDDVPAAATVLVDMTEVAFIDSTGLRVLALARSRLEAGNGHLVVCASEESPVLRTMRLAGLLTDFHVIADPAELTETK
jgi:anti-sigma B factor antagonist